MKKLMNMIVAGLLAQQITQAQGTIYLSNLGQASEGSLAVGSDSWYAVFFQTGNNAAGYLLDSVQLGMDDATGNPSDFTVMLCPGVSQMGGIFPGSSLATLNGSVNPSTMDTYSYTPDSSLTLSPGFYFIVLTAGTTIANGAYGWSYTGVYDYSQDGGWQTFANVFHSNNGSTWNSVSSSDAQFAITASTIPEPSVLGLLSLGGLFFLRHHWKIKPVQ